MYNIKFTKISNNHNKLRDDEIYGNAVELPTIGKIFIFTGMARDIVGGIRMVNTSNVVEIISEENNEIIFKTESGSVYKVEYKTV